MEVSNLTYQIIIGVAVEAGAGVIGVLIRCSLKQFVLRDQTDGWKKYIDIEADDNDFYFKIMMWALFTDLFTAIICFWIKENAKDANFILVGLVILIIHIAIVTKVYDKSNNIKFKKKKQKIIGIFLIILPSLTLIIPLWNAINNKENLFSSSLGLFFFVVLEIIGLIFFQNSYIFFKHSGFIMHLFNGDIINIDDFQNLKYYKKCLYIYTESGKKIIDEKQVVWVEVYGTEKIIHNNDRLLSKIERRIKKKK